MNSRHSQRTNAFTLVEMLMTLAIISVMAALVISAFSNATADSREVMARQQQATVQSALDNWIAQRITGTRTVKEVRDEYNVDINGDDNTSLARLGFIQVYLDKDTYDHFTQNSTADGLKVRSAAMVKAQKYITLGTWAEPDANNRAPYPKVELKDE